MNINGQADNFFVTKRLFVIHISDSLLPPLIYILSNKTGTSSCGCQSQSMWAWTSPGHSQHTAKLMSKFQRPRLPQATWLQAGFSLRSCRMSQDARVHFWVLAPRNSNTGLQTPHFGDYLSKPIWTISHVWFIIETTGKDRKSRQKQCGNNPQGY